MKPRLNLRRWEASTGPPPIVQIYKCFANVVQLICKC